MKSSQNNQTVSNTTAGFGVAAAVAIVLNTLLVWLKEGNPVVLQFMKSIAHHWIVHSVTISILFLVLGSLFSRMSFARQMKGYTVIVLIILSFLSGSLGIFGWFLIKG